MDPELPLQDWKNIETGTAVKIVGPGVLQDIKFSHIGNVSTINWMLIQNSGTLNDRNECKHEIKTVGGAFNGYLHFVRQHDSSTDLVLVAQIPTEKCTVREQIASLD